MTIELGATPDTLKVHLTTGGDFTSTLVLTDEDGTETDWPDETEISLRFPKSTATWDATIDGAEATFAVDKANVDVAIVKKRDRVGLYYVNGDDDIPLAIGKVVVHD